MAYPMPRYRAAPELVTTYSVSEYETPAPRLRPEILEDSLDIQELSVAPSLSRGQGYRRGNGNNYENQRSVALAPPTLDVYPEEYERVGDRPQVPRYDTYDYDRQREHGWHQRRAVSPPSSYSSSGSSAQDCGECAYAESKRRYDNGYRGGRINLVPFNIIPGDYGGRRASPLPAHGNAAHYIHEAPRAYRPPSFQGPPPPPRGGFRGDRITPNADVRYQIVLYRDAARSSSSEGWIAFERMHSNVSSSPGWSTMAQRHLSGSETQSETRSGSFSSFDGSYEDPHLRFARQMPRRMPLSHPRPVVVTRSNDSGEYHDSSSSDESYCSSERSLNSGGYYRRGGTRR